MFTVFLAVKRCYCQSPLLLFRTLLSSPLTKRSGKEMEKRVDNLIASSSSSGGCGGRISTSRN